jgi:hypothetical protein
LVVLYEAYHDAQLLEHKAEDSLHMGGTFKKQSLSSDVYVSFEQPCTGEDVLRLRKRSRNASGATEQSAAPLWGEHLGKEAALRML